MQKTVSFADLARGESTSRPNFDDRLKYVGLSDNETPVIMFTKEVVETTLHYCKEPEIKTYIHCNGPDCLLCATGVKQVNMKMTPVYQLESDEIGVLSFTDSMKPMALLPQMLNVFGNPLPQVLFIRKESSTKFHLSARPVPKGLNFGEDRIAAFMADWGNDKYDLKTINATYTNIQLAYLPGIRQILQIKGIPVPVLEGITPSSAEYESVNEPEAAVTSDFLKFVV
jgi:hypothetical protein